MISRMFERREAPILGGRKTPSSLEHDRVSLHDLESHFRTWIDTLHDSARQVPESIGSKHGEIEFEGELTLNCYVCADVRAPNGALIVTASAEIDGDILVRTAVVQGLVRGEITAQKLELGRTAEVIGHIHATALSIEAGAVFEGQSAHLSQTVNRQPSVSASSASSEDGCEDACPPELAVA